MVRFGLQLQQEAKQEWADMYLDYSRLKAQLKTLNAKATTHIPFLGRSDHATPADIAFATQLDEEIEKVVLFFLTKQGELAHRLQDHRRNQIPSNQQRLDHIDHLIELYRAAGHEIIGKTPIPLTCIL